VSFQTDSKRAFGCIKHPRFRLGHQLPRAEARSSHQTQLSRGVAAWRTEFGAALQALPPMAKPLTGNADGGTEENGQKYVPVH